MKEKLAALQERLAARPQLSLAGSVEERLARIEQKYEEFIEAERLVVMALSHLTEFVDKKLGPIPPLEDWD